MVIKKFQELFLTTSVGFITWLLETPNRPLSSSSETLTIQDFVLNSLLRAIAKSVLPTVIDDSGNSRMLPEMVVSSD